MGCEIELVLQPTFKKNEMELNRIENKISHCMY